MIIASRRNEREKTMKHFRDVYTWGNNGYFSLENPMGELIANMQSKEYPNFMYGRGEFNFSSCATKNITGLVAFYSALDKAVNSGNWVKFVEFVSGGNYQEFHQESED